jgi:predicted chitinase
MPEAVNLSLGRAKMPDGPYPGLRPFEPHEWSIFFGREVMTTEVITRLGRQNLILVHGASGCGKSSLVRAGVLPVLQSDHDLNRRDFRYSVIRPSQGPLDALATALLAHLGPANGRNLEESWLDRFAIERDLVGTIEQRLQGKNATFCLVIDQFEEIFRWAEERDRAEAEFLVDFMRAAAAGDRVSRNFFVLATMRSDYLGQCAQFRDFAPVVNDCQYLLDNLDEFGVLRAIQEPAERFSGSVDPVLADRLRFMAKDDVDALPILQHTLMRMYEALPDKESGWALDLQALAEVSGDTGPLSEHAEAIYQEVAAGSPEREIAVEWMFRALTELDAGGRAIRRPCRFEELVAVSGTDEQTVGEIVDAFGRAGRNFLVVTSSEHGAKEVDVSHEALIRRWRRIGDNSIDPDTGQRTGWLFREFQAGLIWKALAVFANRGETTIEPTMTRQWLNFFDQVEDRPAWAARYFVDPLPGIPPEKQPEWARVMALVAASKARLRKETNALRRVLLRSWAYLLAVAGLLAAIGMVSYLQLQDKYRSAEKQAAESGKLYRLANQRAEGAVGLYVWATAQIREATAQTTQARREMLDAKTTATRAATLAAAQLAEARQAQRRAQATTRSLFDAARAQIALMQSQYEAQQASQGAELAERERLARLSTQAILESLAPLTRGQETQAKRFAAEPAIDLPEDFRAGLHQVLGQFSSGRVDIEAIADWIENRRRDFGLTTDKRLAAFLAIISIDTDRFTELEEPLDLASENQVVAYYGPWLADPTQARSFVHHPEALAHEVYDGRLGNAQPGEGWAFRGRGLIWIRGRTEYTEMGAHVPVSDLTVTPERLLQPPVMVQAAMERWGNRQGNSLTDDGRIFRAWRWISGRRPFASDLYFFDREFQFRTAIARVLRRAAPQRY